MSTCSEKYFKGGGSNRKAAPRARTLSASILCLAGILCQTTPPPPTKKIVAETFRPVGRDEAEHHGTEFEQLFGALLHQDAGGKSPRARDAPTLQDPKWSKLSRGHLGEEPPASRDPKTRQGRDQQAEHPPPKHRGADRLRPCGDEYVVE